MENLIKKIAGKLEIDEEIIEKAIRTQFRFIAETMQEGNFESVHLHFLGKFAVRPNALNRVNQLKEFKDKNIGLLT